MSKLSLSSSTMALIIKEGIKGYTYIFNDLADPRVKDYFLMGSPFQPIICVAAYLVFILKLGPNLMKTRPAIQMDKLLIIYNLGQVLANLYVFTQLFPILLKFNCKCNLVDYSLNSESLKITTLCHFYMILKVSDLLDTIFFILKKNERQINFLHIYHHTGMIFASWILAKFVPGGQSLFLPFLNSFVHIVMYFYYFLTCLDNEKFKNIWWKKYITQMQLLQFIVIFYFTVRPLVNASCAFPKIYLFLILPQEVMMIFLFSDFYIKNYIKTRKAK